MHTVFALLCFVVVIHWLIFPYPSGLRHWHCGNLTIASVPAKQPWWIWINTSCEFIMKDCITTTKHNKTECIFLEIYCIPCWWTYPCLATTWQRLQSRLCSAKATGIWRLCNGLGIMFYEYKIPLTTVHDNLNGTRYRDDILDVTVRQHFQQFQAEQPMFMDDNARPHRERLVDAYKVWHNIDSQQWPSMSPNLNLIEHAWDALQKAANVRQPLVTTLQELDMTLHQEWNQMAWQTCRKLVQSMRRRCQAVVEARRGHTHYWCSCHASVNILLKVTLGKMMICYEIILLPHLFWFKDFLLRSPSQWIETFLLSKMGIF